MSKNVIGKTFKFNLSDKKDYLNEVSITYLGEIHTKTKEKVLHSNLGQGMGTGKSECDQSLVTKIDFSEIPKNIFIKCNGELGDVYTLNLDSLEK